MTNHINVSLENQNNFIVVDSDTGKTISIDAAIFHTKSYIVVEAMERYFLSLFPGKEKCVYTEEAHERLKNIADWNADYEDDVVW